MKKLLRLRNLLVGLFFYILLFAACRTLEVVDNQSSTSTSSPNIIVIMADDLGYETISANGGKSYQTPHIDKLALNGVRFEHFYAQPLCTPSRVKLMTGIYNVRNYVRFGLLHPSQTTFGHLFQDAGYSTCIVGKWQLGKDPKSPGQAGFDEHCLWQVTEGRVDDSGRDTRFSKPVLETNGKIKQYEEHDFGPEIVSQYGLDFIERSHKHGHNFLLYYPMILTHCPFSPTPNSPEWAVDDTTVMAYKGQAHYFEDMMSYTDDIIGKINGKLEELGIRDNTIILFTGDNGTDVPVVSQLDKRLVAGAKGESTDAGTRVPLVVQWPNEIPAGQVNKDLVDLSDVLPTICEASRIDIPATLDIDGRSFLPQLKGEKGNPREWIYNWYSRGGEVEKASVFARTKTYKLYDNGLFYNVPTDYEEKNSLEFDSLTPKEKAINSMLSEVLKDYGRRRLEDIPSTVK